MSIPADHVAILLPLARKAEEAQTRYHDARVHERSRRTAGLASARWRASRKLFGAMRDLGYSSNPDIHRVLTHIYKLVQS